MTNKNVKNKILITYGAHTNEKFAVKVGHRLHTVFKEEPDVIIYKFKNGYKKRGKKQLIKITRENGNITSRYGTEDPPMKLFKLLQEEKKIKTDKYFAWIDLHCGKLERRLEININSLPKNEIGRATEKIVSKIIFILAKLAHCQKHNSDPYLDLLVPNRFVFLRDEFDKHNGITVIETEKEIPNALLSPNGIGVEFYPTISIGKAIEFVRKLVAILKARNHLIENRISKNQSQ